MLVLGDTFTFFGKRNGKVQENGILEWLSLVLLDKVSAGAELHYHSF